MRFSAGRGDRGAGWSAWKTGGFLAAAESRLETTEIRKKTRCGIHRQLALPRAIYPDGCVALHASTVTSVLEPGRKAPVEPMRHTELPHRRWSLVPLQALGVQSSVSDNVRRTVRSRVRLTECALILKQRASDVPDSLS